MLLWDTHLDYLLNKASSRLYILRICKFYKYSTSNLDLLFQILILSVFLYAIEVWGSAFYDKYLSRIDKLFARSFKSGYCSRQYNITEILRNRDMKMWQKVITMDTALSDLHPPCKTRQLRNRAHNYILPIAALSPSLLIYVFLTYCNHRFSSFVNMLLCNINY